MDWARGDAKQTYIHYCSAAGDECVTAIKTHTSDPGTEWLKVWYSRNETGKWKQHSTISGDWMTGCEQTQVHVQKQGPRPWQVWPTGVCLGQDMARECGPHHKNRMWYRFLWIQRWTRRGTPIGSMKILQEGRRGRGQYSSFSFTFFASIKKLVTLH